MKILLAAWAAKMYDPPPSAWVLRKWVREGQICPPPERVGHAYYVDEDARRQTGQRLTLVEKLRAMGY